jgi:PleD family two-component response regulator
VGVELAQHSLLNSRALIQVADQALYQAKAKGKNRVEEGVLEAVKVGL